MRSRAYKAIQHLEKDLHTLFQVQLKYLSSGSKHIKAPLAAATVNKSANYLLLDKLINRSPVGLLKRSELGDPMRLYFYSSPLDLIAHFTDHRRRPSLKQLLTSNANVNAMSVEQLVQLGGVGSYLCITLHSLTPPPVKAATGGAGGQEQVPAVKYRLPSASSVLLTESDEKSWHELLAPYFSTTGHPR